MPVQANTVPQKLSVWTVQIWYRIYNWYWLSTKAIATGNPAKKTTKKQTNSLSKTKHLYIKYQRVTGIHIYFFKMSINNEVVDVQILANSPGWLAVSFCIWEVASLLCLQGWMAHLEISLLPWLFLCCISWHLQSWHKSHAIKSLLLVDRACPNVLWLTPRLSVAQQFCFQTHHFVFLC